MEKCDRRVTAYKYNRTFEQCRVAARSIVPGVKARIDKDGHISWNNTLEMSEYDSVVYKLVMKYMREEGYDIGDNITPQIRHRRS
ncbi:MAG: hypothetical protein F4Y82_03870 [Cenarchaeum sp. SB0665_bin_23]|nr:hypothetical protein [Cenarchaeum sp. SB0667_bin_13]MXY38041.1 hypothetical protein [Cenarchaeum sp. SB0664_bin_35]MXY61238.1 hypothetical protein [Cenarchaeum sp. SB0665_bin_23]MXZ93722.1 hypothetical protein [Cenarchaeum sp. SB0666_bin_15]MYB46853.1 hypothetical protein [Cenarchaeum sp. SB0662_bin_33]MYC79161.1 hypothetical protein [Cenarchaeum sp. SB0661_bin_35]MYD58995.1 hypothetical protein [Cenarchaeum sp. SB0678_bin_8]MYG33052.1 hypothetical protein [Cenarchaeum sp. SB0677_bin_16]